MYLKYNPTSLSGYHILPFCLQWYDTFYLIYKFNYDLVRKMCVAWKINENVFLIWSDERIPLLNFQVSDR